MKPEQSLITRYFSNSELKSFVDDFGVAWFQGNHVCSILGYQNPSDVIPLNVEDQDRRKIDIGGLHPVWFVNESGLYDLIIGCKKKVARPFHRWLSHDVLPSIRKHGGYINPDATPDQLQQLQAQIADLERKNAQLEGDLEDAKDQIEYVEDRSDLAYAVGAAESAADARRLVYASDATLEELKRIAKALKLPESKAEAFVKASMDRIVDRINDRSHAYNLRLQGKSPEAYEDDDDYDIGAFS